MNSKTKTFFKILRLTTLGTLILLNTSCFANNNLQKNYAITENEREEFLTNIKNSIVEKDITYNFISYDMKEDVGNSKIITETKKLNNISTKDTEKIRKMVGNEFNFSDSNYEGKIPIKNIDIKTIDNGFYQEIKNHNIKFKDYSVNDLNNIKKEISVKGITYHLINVDWKADKTHKLDGKKVIDSYKGTMKYQAVASYKNPSTYDVVITYEGNVDKKDKTYIYTVNYEENIPPVVEEKKEFPITQTIIISGIGLAIILIILITSKNLKIYNLTPNKKRLIAMKRISRKNKVITLKHNFNTYSFQFKLTKNAFNQLKGETITVYIDNRKYYLHINTDVINVNL